MAYGLTYHNLKSSIKFASNPVSATHTHKPCREVWERVVREIRTLRVMRRELETGLREKTSPRYRASSRPYQPLRSTPVGATENVSYQKSASAAQDVVL